VERQPASRCAPEWPARGGRQSRYGPRRKATGNLLDSIDRKVEKVAAKQRVPFSGLDPRTAICGIAIRGALPDGSSSNRERFELCDERAGVVRQ
jgi:hypothetical protein